MSDRDDNFFSRWSRRKALVRQGVPPPAEQPAVVVPLPVPAAKAAVAPQPVPEASAEAEPVQARTADAEPASPAPVPGPPKPTLEDVEALTPESDFSRFIQRDVDEKVKNSAMKKLFADPHFNVMDGLDTYIDDYNTPDPLPKTMLRQLVQARMLGLLDDEMPEQPAAVAASSGADADAAPDADEAVAEPVPEPEVEAGEADDAAVAAPSRAEGEAEVAVVSPAIGAAAERAQPAAGNASSAS